MVSSEPELAVYICRSCGEYQLASAAPTCCAEPMDEVDDTVPVESPDEADLMRAVFDISETELEVCRHLMSEGELTVRELADLVERDRSVVTRHLTHLVELGMVEKRSRVLSSGGRVNVYSHRSADAVRRQFKLGLYTWMNDAVTIIDDLSEDKIERLLQGESDGEHGPVIVEQDE